MKINDMISKHVEGMYNVTETHKKFVLRLKDKLYNLAEADINLITADDIRKWILSLQERYSPKTIHNIHGALYSVFESAIDIQLIEVNPCKKSKLPRVQMKPMTTLTKEEFKHFMRFVDNHYKPFVYLLFLTGCRWGEALALQKDDIDFTAKTIIINKAWSERETVLSLPKTEKSNRVLHITDFLCNILKSHLKNNPGNEFIFMKPNGIRIRNSEFRRKVWLPALKKMNEYLQIDKHLRIHDARHTFATWLLTENVPIHVVSEYLGHNSIETTVKRYGHISPESYRQLLEALEF